MTIAVETLTALQKAAMRTGIGLAAIGNSEEFGYSDGKFSRLAANSLSLNASLALSGGTRTTSVPLINGSQTWNDGAVTFHADTIDITNTASATASTVFRRRVGGSDIVSVDRSGDMTIRKVKASATDLDLWAGASGSVRFLTSAGTLGVFFNPGNANFGLGSSADVVAWRDAANTWGFRNGTNAQCANIYGTSSSNNTVYERLALRYSSGNSRFEIATEHAGASARALALMTNGTARLVVSADNTSVTVESSNLIVVGSQLRINNGGIKFNSTAGGILKLSDSSESDFGRLCLGGTTSSYPALKRSSAILQARLADDSAFATFQGKLQTDTAYTAGDPTTTGYIVIYDSTGTAYRIPALLHS